MARGLDDNAALLANECLQLSRSQDRALATRARGLLRALIEQAASGYEGIRVGVRRILLARPFTSVGDAPQDRKDSGEPPRLEIGDRTNKWPHIFS